jgi:hypothetical protein
VKAVHPVHLKTTPKVQQKREKEEMRLEDKGGTLGLLVTTELEVLASLEGELEIVSAYSSVVEWMRRTCALVLHCVHSRRRTTFLVVFALYFLGQYWSRAVACNNRTLWKTGLV